MMFFGCSKQKVDLATSNEKKSEVGVLRGMSFLEIMIVIVIMASIAAIAGPALFNQLAGSNVKQAKIQMENFRQSLELYKLDNNTYPTSEQGLAALIRKPELGQLPTNWNGPYMNQATVPKDPWGNDFLYSGDRTNYTITSLGEDQLEGGANLATDIVCTPLACQ